MNSWGKVIITHTFIELNKYEIVFGKKSTL